MQDSQRATAFTTKKYLGQQVGVAVAIDIVTVGLFVWYLIAAGREKRAATVTT